MKNKLILHSLTMRNIFSWEILEDHFNKNMNQFSSDSIFSKFSTNIKLYRDDDFRVKFKLSTNNLAVPDDAIDRSRQVGEVYTSDSKFCIGSSYSRNSNAELLDINHERVSHYINPIQPQLSSKIFTGTVGYLKCNISDEDEKYSIDWILNICLSNFFPYGLTNYYKNSIDFSCMGVEIKLGNNINDVLIGSARNSYYMTVGGFDIVVGKINSRINSVDEDRKSGFIFYRTKVSEDKKREIMNALSFLLGRQLLCIGSTKYDKNWSVVGYEARTPYIISSKIFGLPSEPPSNVSNNMNYQQGTIIKPDIVFIQNFIEKVMGKYKSSNLDHVFWLYWHALYSPVHLRAGNFGAIIEFVLKGVAVDCTMISPEYFKKLKIILDNVLDDFYAENPDLNPDSKGSLHTKISNFNSISIQQRNSRALLTLDISWNEFENSLWKRRHDTAHGNVNKGCTNKFVREIRAIQTLCNRVLLRYLGLSDHYIDYYNIGYPIRQITDSIQLDGNL